MAWLVVDGKFGAYMQVNIQNDGPVTITLESPPHNQVGHSLYRCIIHLVLYWPTLLTFGVKPLGLAKAHGIFSLGALN